MNLTEKYFCLNIRVYDKTCKQYHTIKTIKLYTRKITQKD